MALPLRRFKKRLGKVVSPGCAVYQAIVIIVELQVTKGLIM
jgi:hypothetical protein